LGLSITDAAVCQGLTSAQWPARLELMGQQPLIVLDCAHNVASVQALIDTIRESFQVSGQKQLILAVSNDKQLAEMMKVLGPHFDHFHLTRYANNPRCTPPETLANLLITARPDAHFTMHDQASKAWLAARTAAGPDDLIAVTGSVFLAGELRPLLIPS
jgi:dihydrofolate synthase/folylpolyglutamate synthase